MRHRPAAVCRTALAVLGLALAPAAPAEDDAPSVKESLAQLGRGVRSVTREAGHAFRDGARATTAEAKRAATEVADATSDERREAVDAGEGVLARASRRVSEALDQLAEAIASLRED